MRPIIIVHRISILDSTFRFLYINCFVMPFWKKKPTLEDQVIELKISSKTLNSQYKKCEAEAKRYEKMVRQVLSSNSESCIGNR